MHFGNYLLLRAQRQTNNLLSKGLLAKRTIQHTERALLSTWICELFPTMKHAMRLKNSALTSKWNAIQISLYIQCMYEWSIPYYSSNKTLSVSHYLLVPFLSTYGLRVISNWNRRRSPYLGKIVQSDLNAAKINAVYTGNFEYTCYTKIAWNQANMWGKKISEEPFE